MIDNAGSISSVRCDVPIGDIATHTLTDQIHCIYWNRKDIRSLDETGNTKQVVELDENPLSLAFLPQDQILIGNEKEQNVHIYTLKGEKLRTIACSGCPYHTTICRSTGKIGIACGFGGTMVLDVNFKHLFTAKSDIRDVEFDEYGHIIAGSDYHKCIYVFNSNTGELLQTIPTEIIKWGVECLVTQNNGNLYVGTRRPNALLSIKYLQ